MCMNLWALSGCFDNWVLWLDLLIWSVSSGVKTHEVLWSLIPSPPFPVAFQAHVFPAKLGAAEFQTAGHTETEPGWDWLTIQGQPSLNPQQSRWHLLLLGRLSEWQEEKEDSQGKFRALAFLFGFFQAGMWVWDQVFFSFHCVASLQGSCCPGCWLDLCLNPFLPEGEDTQTCLHLSKKLFFHLRFHNKKKKRHCNFNRNWCQRERNSSYFAEDVPHHTSFCASWMGQSEIVCVLCVCFLLEICCSLLVLIDALAVYNLRCDCRWAMNIMTIGWQKDLSAVMSIFCSNISYFLLGYSITPFKFYFLSDLAGCVFNPNEVWQQSIYWMFQKHS